MAEYGGTLLPLQELQKPSGTARRSSVEKLVAKSGAAFMFSHAMNVIVGQKEDRKLMAGVFSVAGIHCSNCGQEIGWKYIRAYDPRQMFKEGRFIIERAKIVKVYY